ncbi:MAG: YncE family protein, partial [bacterium]
MRRIAVLSSLLVALAAGQYIEKYIPLPDSFGSATDPRSVAHDPVRNRLYVPGYYRVLVVDAATGARVDTLPVDLSLGPICFDTAGNRLYVSNSPDRQGNNWEILVFDGTTDSLRARIPTGSDYVVEFSPNPVAGKLLCLLGEENWVQDMLVLSTAGDSVVALVTPRTDPVPCAAFNPLMNRHYIAGDREVLVFDGVSDSLRAPVLVNLEVEEVCYNPVGNTVYCGTGDDGGWVYVIDCSLNVVVDSFLRHAR